MPSVVSGENLGLFNNTLNLQGGTGGVGNNGDRTYINGFSGNLVIQHQDEFLKSAGLDLGLVRTYNSQGLMDDDNGDNWKLNIHQRLYGLTGTVNSAGSSITKVYGDGAEGVFSYDPERGLYVSTEGRGAHDTLSYNSGSETWSWSDGTPGVEERYNSAGQLIQSLDRDGNSIDYSYSGALLTQISDNASGQTVFLDYSGNNLSQIRTLSDGQEQTRVRYSYDISDRLTQVTVDLTPEDNDISDGNTFTTVYTYDGSSTRINSISNSDGSSQAFSYEEIDGDWRIKTLTDGEGRITTLSYSEVSGEQLLTLTDPLGHSTIYTHDSQGRLSKIEGPEVGGARVVC
jgi:YD repeat-containing protein